MIKRHYIHSSNKKSRTKNKIIDCYIISIINDKENILAKLIHKMGLEISFLKNKMLQNTSHLYLKNFLDHPKC